MVKRRDFIAEMAILTAGLMLPHKGFSLKGDKLGNVLPLRKLGSTGEEVTMLGVGGYHVGWTSEKDAQEVIETGIELGIRFFDTAHSYGSGTSELRYGKYLVPKYRDQIFLMTKSTATTYQSAKEELELSLKRLNTDQIDLWQVHSLRDPEDVDNRVNNGVLKLVEEALAEKKIRHAGFTCHQNPYAMLRMLEHVKNNNPFSTAQMPVNVIDANSQHSFTMKVMPKLLEEKMAVLAMKTLADGRFFNHKQVNEKVLWKTETPVVPDQISIESAMQFSWSLPISTLITGAENASLLREKVDFAKRLVALSEDERKFLLGKITKHELHEKVEYYKRV